MTARLRRLLLPFAYFSNNLISRVGIVLVTAATVFWFLLLPQLISGGTNNPYVGILLFVALPAAFIGGLLLIPLGVWLARRRAHARGQADPVVFDFRDAAVRQLFLFVVLATGVNVVIASQLSYSAVHYMESSSFCGQMCHVMNPEFTAYKQSAHSNVACVECHVGPGATGFVKAKLAGTRQLITLSTGTYPRPIPEPDNLPTAEETCLRCHSPERFTGEKTVTRKEFAEDETNTLTSTVMKVKVGGGKSGGGLHGAHLKPGARMEYALIGDTRKEIPQVTYFAPDGKTTVYRSTETKLTAEQLAAARHRTMDCMDCHSRPAHVFQMPERALDDALASGDISPTLPFVKKQALAALRANYADQAAAAREIEGKLAAFYKTTPADAGKVQSAIAAVKSIYSRNVFPEMKIVWGSYPTQLGHTDAPGCFRCHDGNHASADGKVISNDCSTCHEMQ